MIQFPHKDKLEAALANPKAAADREILEEAMTAYNTWITKMQSITSTGDDFLREMVSCLNEYKDYLEVELVARKGSDFLKRQKGQLKLDNSVIEEFLPHLVDPKLLNNLPTAFAVETGSQTSFMSLSFCPSSIQKLDDKPEIVIKDKDQDFTIGKSIYYKFSSDKDFSTAKTIDGKLFLAVLAAECKVNYDKTMFQECAGTAARLKQGCPISKYYALVEYLDMQPEDVRLTSIDNVFLLRKAKRLPYEKRSVYEEVRRQHEENPISFDVMKAFVKEMQNFIDATWYDPDAALSRGSFV
ncbi:MAG: Bpu10I family restriction endonuclease [Bacteroidales bacterium]|nr:Bpu10I family restriction endonuclease [Bacteroidales bacterium]